MISWLWHYINLKISGLLSKFLWSLKSNYVNILCCRNLKTYIKTFCCFPERCTLEGYEAIMADFRNSEKVKNGRLMSFLLSRGLMAFACVCTTLKWWRKCSRISLWLFFFLSRATNSTLNQTTAILSHLKKKMLYHWNTFTKVCNCCSQPKKPKMLHKVCIKFALDYKPFLNTSLTYGHDFLYKKP